MTNRIDKLLVSLSLGVLLVIVGLLYFNPEQAQVVAKQYLFRYDQLVRIVDSDVYLLRLSIAGGRSGQQIR